MPKSVSVSPAAATVETQQNPLDLLDALNTQIVLSRDEANAAITDINKTTGANTTQSIATIVADTTIASFAALADDAARIDKLRENQRDMALMIRAIRDYLVEERKWMTAQRAADAISLRHLNNL